MCLCIICSFSQKKNKIYYIVDKGLYVELDGKFKRMKVPYKEGEDFYFSLKNDSTALIQEFLGKKLAKVKEYKISAQYDTVFIKNFFLINGRRILKVEKKVFQRVTY